MRHFLAKILNCAAPLFAALPAIFLVPGLSDLAAINSSGRESPHVPADSIPVQRTDIFSPGAESDRAPSIAPDVIVDRASISFGAEPKSVRAHLDQPLLLPIQSNLRGRLGSRLPPKSAFLLNSRLNQMWGNLARPAEVLRAHRQKLPKLVPICLRRRAPDTP